MRALRPWADKVHIAAQNVPELRNLIDANLPDDAAHASHAVVAVAGPYRTILFRVHSHRAKLHHHKRPAVLADALLFIEHRSARIDLNKDCRDQHDGERKNRANQSHESVDDYSEDFIRTRAPSAARKDQP